MKQFSLKACLERPDRKVMTRNGRNVRIICTNRLDENYPVVALVNDEYLAKYPKDMKVYSNLITQNLKGELVIEHQRTLEEERVAEILKEDEDMCVLSCSRTDDYYIWTATPYSDAFDVCCGFPCMVIPTIIYE